MAKLIKVISASILGLEAQLIEVEVDLTSGLHSFSIVGLADKAIGESKERVSSAIKNIGAKYPKKFNKRITVNLAPANIKKEGALYDLPIAIAFLAASDQLLCDLENKLFLGELSLDGRLRSVNGVLAIALSAVSLGIKEIYLPKINAKEAAIVKGITVYGVSALSDLIMHLEGKKIIAQEKMMTHTFSPPENRIQDIDMAYIKGQTHAKRAMEIAAAGAHNILMGGPPGGGKTLIAKTLPTILPKMRFEESLEVSKIYSIAGLLTKDKPLITCRPFRSPHHSSSEAAIIGGGSSPRPGEISLAHRGVLFLDEFPEIHRDVLESLRQPLEEGEVTVSRTHGTTLFPSRFMLVAAHNPCPCGFLNDSHKECSCNPGQISRYRKKLSGPILDRIDIHIEVPKVEYEKLASNTLEEPSFRIRERVGRARALQDERFKKDYEESGKIIFTNSEMPIPLIKKYCQVGKSSQDLLKNAVTKLSLSARSYHKILKVARTIADLAERENIEAYHVAEAIQYRQQSEL